MVGTCKEWFDTIGRKSTLKLEPYTHLVWCAALASKVVKNTSTNKPSATCLLCGHMEICYYYKHSGGGCCGKFVPRTSHVG